MVVKVEILYTPTCANNLIWLEKLKEIMGDFGEDVIVKEIDVWEHPEAMKKYWSSVWPEFKEGLIHYFILVAVNNRVIDWYWDISKVAEAIRRELDADKNNCARED